MHRCHPCCTATPGLSSTADPPSYPTLSPNIYWAHPGYSALSLTIHPLLLFFQIHIESLTAQHRSCPHPRPRSHRPPGLLPCVLNVPLGHSCPTQQPQHFTHTPFMARDSPGCPPHSIPLSSTGPQCPSLLQRTGDPGQVTHLSGLSVTWKARRPAGQGNKQDGGSAHRRPTPGTETILYPGRTLVPFQGHAASSCSSPEQQTAECSQSGNDPGLDTRARRKSRHYSTVPGMSV